EGRIGLVDHDLAGLDADASLEAEVTSALEDAEAGADGALGVVLVREGDAECRHHGIASELLDRSAVRLDAAGDAVEEGRDPAAGDLGVLSGHELGRSHEVREQHSCELSLHAEILGTAAGARTAAEAAYGVRRRRTKNAAGTTTAAAPIPPRNAAQGKEFAVVTPASDFRASNREASAAGTLMN